MADEQESGYNVVFRYTAAAKGYQGIITWSRFPSKEDFDEWFRRGNAPHREIICEGVTRVAAIRECQQTPVAFYVAAATQDCTDNETGILNRKLLAVRLREIRRTYQVRAAELERVA